MTDGKVSAEQLGRMLDEVIKAVERAGFEEACLQVEITVTNAERRQVSYSRWVPEPHDKALGALQRVSMRNAMGDEVDDVDMARLRAAVMAFKAAGMRLQLRETLGVPHPAVAGAVAFLATTMAHIAALVIAVRRRKAKP